MTALLLLPETLYGFLCAGLLGVVMLALLPRRRPAVRNMLVLLLILGGFEAGAWAAYFNGALRAASVCAGIAAFGIGGICIRMTTMLVFEVALPAVRMGMPRIVEELSTTAVIVGWAMYWLHGAGVDLASLVTTSAVITAVLAFSMQDTLGNIVGGLVLQLDNSLCVGDWVKIDDVSGQVVDVRWRHTAIETRNRETVIIPNGWLVKNRFSVIGSRNDPSPRWRRWLWFDVEAGAPPKRVMELLENSVNDSDIPSVLHDPPPNAVLMEAGARVSRYALRYWLADPRPDDATDTQVRVHALAALDRHNIRLVVKMEERLIVQGDDGSRNAAEFARRRQALANIELFASLAPAELDTLAQGLTRAPFVAGDTITRQGAVAHWLYLLVSGDADVWAEENGTRNYVATLPTGDVFGEMGMMTGEPRSATVTAKSDVECFRLDKTAFEAILRERPDIAEEISTVIANRRSELDQLRGAAGLASAHANRRDAVLARIRGFFGLDQEG